MHKMEGYISDSNWPAQRKPSDNVIIVMTMYAET